MGLHDCHALKAKATCVVILLDMPLKAPNNFWSKPGKSHVGRWAQMWDDCCGTVFHVHRSACERVMSGEVGN